MSDVFSNSHMQIKSVMLGHKDSTYKGAQVFVQRLPTDTYAINVINFDDGGSHGLVKEDFEVQARFDANVVSAAFDATKITSGAFSISNSNISVDSYSVTGELRT